MADGKRRYKSDRKDYKVSVKLSEKDMDILKAALKRTGMTASAYIRELIQTGGNIDTINDKCKNLAIKVKEIIDTKSSFADWLNNQNVRDQLKLEIKICLVKNGYPPQYSPEVFKKVMEQVENFEEYSSETVEKGNNASAKIYQYEMPESIYEEWRRMSSYE